MEIVLSKEEKIIAGKVDVYFKADDMTFREKVFNALLIAQYDLDAQHFSTEKQRARLMQFKNILDSLWQKLN